MDIYSAEKSTQKVLEYVQLTAKSDKGLYNSSKQRFKNIYEMCNQIISVITGLVKIEVQQSEPKEIRQLDDLRKQIKVLFEEIKEIKAIVSQPKIAEPVQEKPSVNNDEKLSPTAKREIVGRYAAVLEKSSKTDCGVSVVNQCADILWKWYEARIFGKYPNAQQFNYNPRSLKDVLYSLVLTFGYHFENETLEVFLRDFEEWLTNLRTSPLSHTYIAQREVFQVYKNMGKEYANLTAVVMWDVLWDNGLKELCSIDHKHNAHLSEYGIWDKVKNANPNLLDLYKHYEDEDPSILERLNLT